MHCGAQTTADTVALSTHAAEVGADAVVVIGPPYFKLDEQAQYAPLPRRRDRVRAAAVLRLRVRGDDRVCDRAGCARAAARTTSRTSSGSRCPTRRSSAFEKYLLPGFDIFVGPEALIAEGMARGAIGAVSALASALPAKVAAVVRDPTPEGAARLARLRAFVERFPRQAALKRLLALQGVPVTRGRARSASQAHGRGARGARRLGRGVFSTYAESNSS